MIDNKLCELLIQEYYTDVMNFCRAKLMDEEAAKDCAQGGIHTFLEDTITGSFLITTQKTDQLQKNQVTPPTACGLPEQILQNKL